MLGGYSSDVKIKDDDIQQIVDKVRAKVEEQYGELNQLEVVHYKSQIVCGTNYKVKVKADENLYFHLHIFNPLPCYGSEPELKNVVAGVSLEDAL